MCTALSSVVLFQWKEGPSGPRFLRQFDKGCLCPDTSRAALQILKAPSLADRYSPRGRTTQYIYKTMSQQED